MSPREIAMAQARGRIAVGASLMLLPALAARSWIGGDSARPTTKLFSRAFGARDLAIGLGVVIALDRGAPVRGWLEASALADATDLVATWLARRDLPRGALPMVTLVAGGSTLLDVWLARELDEPPEPAARQAPEAALTGHPG